MVAQPSIIGSAHNGHTAHTGSGTTYYWLLGFGGTLNGNTAITTESLAQTTHRAGATLSNLGCYVSANSRTNANTLRSRINGSNGNQAASITALTTGFFVDTSNSDTIVSGDNVNASVVNGSGTQAITYQSIYAKLQPSGSYPIVYLHATGASPSAGSASTVYRCPFAGALGINMNSTSDTNADHHNRAAGTLTNFYIDVSTNARGTATSCGVRIGGSAGNNLVSVTAGATGKVEDTTNSDSITNSSLVNLYVLTGTGTGAFNVRRIGAMFTGSSQSFDMNLGLPDTLQVLAGTTYFAPMFGRLENLNGNTNEASAQINMPFSGRASNLRMRFGLNNTSTTTTRLRKNGSDGNQAVSVAAGGSGFVEDTSNHDDFVAGDLLCYTKGSAGSTSNTFNNIGMMITQPAAVTSGDGGGLMQVVT